MIAHHGLKTAHEALEAGNVPLGMRLLLLRHIMMEIANVADIAAISIGLYKDNPELGELHKPIKKSLEFFKYVRNIYIGHFVPGLTEKMFEWIPFANSFIGSADEGGQSAMSAIALETAINTYAYPETGHKIFSSDTDLNYPPDQTRFLNFLGETALGALAYTAHLIQVSRAQFETPDMQKDAFQLSIMAGKTEFSVLSKGKR